MLPPKELPQDLEYRDYLKLFFRYQILSWPRQVAAASKLMLEKAPPSG